MKKSLTANRPSKGPVRISLHGSAGGGNDGGNARPSLLMTTSRIPVKASRPSNDLNPQSIARQSRLAVQDFAKKSVARRSRSSAAGRTSATPSTKNTVGKATLTPRYNEGRRSRSAHSPFTPNVFVLNTGKKTDSRPINDKAFQQRAMVEVYNYFQAAQPPQPGSITPTCPIPGTRSIMIKTFYELVTFLLVQVIPNATINGSNYTTEIPLLMKVLKYPGNLSSSWLKSANTMHSWPHVVALLSWLVEYVKALGYICYDEREAECALLTNEELFDYFDNAFTLWNEGNDYQLEQIKKEFLCELRNRVNIDDEEFKRVHTVVQELEAELNSPEEQAAVAYERDLEEQYKKAKFNEKRLLETIESKSWEMKALEEAINEEHEIQTSLKNKKPLLLKQLDDILETISTQKMSKSQLDEILKSWDVMDTQLEQQAKYKEKIEKLHFDASLKSSVLQNKLEKWTLDYNTAILTIGLDNPELVQLDMNMKVTSLQKWQETANAFQSLIEARKQQIENMNILHRELASQEQERREKVAKCQDELHALCAEETALKDRRKNILAEYELKEKKLHDEISSLEASIQDILKSDCNLSELQDELQAAKKREIQCKKECEESQTRGANFLKDYRDYLVKTLEKIYGDLGHEDIVFLRAVGKRNGGEI